MNIQHKSLASGRWKKFSLAEQMANIGSEVERAISWKKKKNKQYRRLAFFRAMELIDLTIADLKNRRRLKEIIRIREFLADFFLGENHYHFSDAFWQKYFYPFNHAARAS
jgi:hypothetical protein